MGGDVRTTVGVPKLSAFANGSGTPLVIDTATGVGYFTDKNTVVPITGGSASGVTSVNGETGVVVLDAADVGAVAKTGDTMTGDLNMGSGTGINTDLLRVYEKLLTPLIKSDTDVDAIAIAASGELTFPSMAQSLASNGYVKLPGGLIIQWGQVSVSISAGPTGQTGVTFPVTFPSACQMVSSSVSATNNTAEMSKVSSTPCVDRAPSGYTQQVYAVTGNTLNVTISFNWIAIGY